MWCGGRRTPTGVTRGCSGSTRRPTGAWSQVGNGRCHGLHPSAHHHDTHRDSRSSLSEPGGIDVIGVMVAIVICTFGVPAGARRSRRHRRRSRAFLLPRRPRRTSMSREPMRRCQRCKRCTRCRRCKRSERGATTSTRITPNSYEGSGESDGHAITIPRGGDNCNPGHTNTATITGDDTKNSDSDSVTGVRCDHRRGRRRLRLRQTAPPTRPVLRRRLSSRASAMK